MTEKNIVLILTEEQDAHADYMVTRLRERHPEVEVVRFHTELFPHQATLDTYIANDGFRAELRFHNRVIDLTRVRSVWVRRPRPPVLDERLSDEYVPWAKAESEHALFGLLRGLDAFFMNPFDANRGANFKLFQLRKAQQLGFRISPTLVTTLPESARAFVDAQPDGAVIKPIYHAILAEGTGADRIFYTSKLRRESLDGEEGERIRLVPVKLQGLVKKVSEVRVTVIGNQVFAAAIRTDSDEVDIRRWSKTNPTYELHTLPDEVVSRCRDLTRQLGLVYGAIDLMLTPEGEYIFLEINPSGQFVWIELNVDVPMVNAVADLLASGGVLERVG